MSSSLETPWPPNPVIKKIADEPPTFTYGEYWFELVLRDGGLFWRIYRNDGETPSDPEIEALAPVLNFVGKPCVGEA